MDRTNPTLLVAHLHFPTAQSQTKMQKSYQANAPQKPKTERLKMHYLQQAVWQNGGFSAKFNGSSSIKHLCKTEHLCFDFRHFAKLLKR